MSDYPSKLPKASIDIVDITKNSKGFQINIKPIENTENIESYRIYLSTYAFNLGPNTNPTQFLLKEIPYSTKEEYFYHVPKTTGTHYLTIFSKNNLGYESTGILFSGVIPSQYPIREVKLENLNYYTDQILLEDNFNFSGGMSNISIDNTNEVTVRTPYAYIAWQQDLTSNTLENITRFSPENIEYDFTKYFQDNSINFNLRVIPAVKEVSGILSDNTSLRNNSNDIYNRTLSCLGPQIGFLASDLKIQKLNLTTTGDILSPIEKVPEIISENNRHFLFDYTLNYNGYVNKNITYVQGTRPDNTIVFNPEVQKTGDFLNQLINLTGSGSLDIPTPYIQIAQPGHYNNYYLVVEAVDSEGNSSAGGNINNYNSQRYTNTDGYKVLKINHNRISQNQVLKIFKNYYREDNNKIVFEIKNSLPLHAGIDSIIILPTKYRENINTDKQTDYYDKFIFLRNLKDIDFLNINPNYKIESMDDQNNLHYKITCRLSSDSLLLNDNIFSVKLYYLNSLEAASLDLYLQSAGYTNDSVFTYLNSTDLIDKYITLNKFIKDNKNYTSTIAASYQGLVYFFTPESYPFISWPNEAYRNAYLNKEGARMLDFERDGIASGPQFFDYFPRAQAEINGLFPNENKYKTTYRCLDAYKYTSTNFEFGLEPEDVPSSGINGSPSYLGGYDPGNIGDQESPETVDFKYVKNDLKYFAAKNIHMIKLLSVGIQKDDAYAIVEFVLDIPDAQDFIVQGISGTDVILEKGIKEINGANYHYFVAKFVSSCGIDIDPILNGEKVDVKNIIDSKKMISFVVYPTKFKIVEDPSDVPFFGDFYLLANNINNPEFSLLKICPFTLLNNNSDCIKNCCVDFNDSINLRSQFKQFFIISRYIGDQIGNDYPYGKICGTNNYVFGSRSWRYSGFDYRSSNINMYYKKPTNPINTLNLGLLCYPEHNVGIHKISIYLKQINDINSIQWMGSDIIDTYVFEEIVKSYPIYLSMPDFDFSNKVNMYEKIIKDYSQWVKEGKAFAIRFVIIDNSGDSISQTFTFENNENC